MNRQRGRNRRPNSDEPVVAQTPRIIGGALRGGKIRYSGELLTRPMKDRVREAVFNLLRDDVAGSQVVDLFAGTGAMTFEALSRGAKQAIAIEQHFPTADLITSTAKDLGLKDQVEVVPGDAFFWAERVVQPGPERRIVFCCPPYDLYMERSEDILALLQHMMELSFGGGILVVECDERFDRERLPRDVDWDLRDYPPAYAAIGRFAARR